MDIALLRKSLLQAIEARQPRRGRAPRAHRRGDHRYEKFLEDTATPVFRAMASALRGEGLQFDVITPSGGVRLVPERTREDGIELDARRHRRSAGADRAGSAHRAAAG